MENDPISKIIHELDPYEAACENLIEALEKLDPLLIIRRKIENFARGAIIGTVASVPFHETDKIILAAMITGWVYNRLVEHRAFYNS